MNFRPPPLHQGEKWSAEFYSHLLTCQQNKCSIFHSLHCFALNGRAMQRDREQTSKLKQQLQVGSSFSFDKLKHVEKMKES